MEAIKFSELPSGDRQNLSDTDGLPIIANQENRLLTWGRLKQQIAEQTHSSTISTANDTEKAKVPTNNAVAEAIATAKTEINKAVDDTKTELTKQITSATTTANTAASTANTAKSTAESAQTTAETLQNALTDLSEQITSVSQNLATNNTYTGWRVEVTAGSVDTESELMTGTPTLSESVEGVDEPLPVAETLALIFRNQEAIYQILMDTRKRAIANATNLTVLLDEINKLLNQVVN